MSLNFVDGLYFTVVTIETIGFGDIHPTNTGTRIFTCCYMVFGIINVGVAVAMTRETVLEGLELGYRKRLRILRLKRREARRFRRWEARWRRAVEWRLKAAGEPLWVPDHRYEQERVRFVGLSGEKDGSGEVHWIRKWLEAIGFRRSDDHRKLPHIRGHPHGKHLNIDALTAQQLEAAALESGVPLEMFLSVPRKTPECESQVRQQAAGEKDKSASEKLRVLWFRRQQSDTNGWPSEPQTPTHAQIGRMAAMITKFTIAVTGAHVHMLGHSAETHEHLERESQQKSEAQTNSVWFDENDPKAVGNRDDEGSEVGKPKGGEAKSKGGLVTEGSLFPKMPEFAKDVAKGRKEEFGFVRERGIGDDAKADETRAYISKVGHRLFSVFTPQL
jgi:potassium channel subfamily K, other eukaryote